MLLVLLLYKSLLATLIFAQSLNLPNGSDPQPPDRCGVDTPGPVQLHSCPHFLSPFNRSLLVEAAYQFPTDGSVLDASGRALTYSEIDGVIKELRARRKQKALSEIAKIQRSYLDNKGLLTESAAMKARTSLARDWEVIPEDARDGINALLSQFAYEPIHGPDLSVIKKAGAAWERSDDLADRAPDPDLRRPSASGLTASRLPMPAPPAIRPAHIFSYDKRYLASSNLDNPNSSFARPSPEIMQQRLEELEHATYRDPKSGEFLPYSEDAKRSIRKIIEYAPAQDSEAVLRVLRTQHPPIIKANVTALPFSDGGACSPVAGENHDPPCPNVVIPEYYVQYLPRGAKEDFRLPHPDPAFYEKLGVPVPAIKALDRSAKPKKVEDRKFGTLELFSDGSSRWRPKSEALWILLEHEILHLDTSGQGGGANHFTNEMRSFYTMNRAWFNECVAQGRADDPKAPIATWLNYPITYRDAILAEYTSPAVGLRPDEISVEQQMEKNRKALAATGEEFDHLRVEEIERRWKRVLKQSIAVVDELKKAGLLSEEQALQAHLNFQEKYQKIVADPKSYQWDYRKYLLWEQEHLKKDQELEVSVLMDDIRWHLDHGYGYLKKE